MDPQTYAPIAVWVTFALCLLGGIFGFSMLFRRVDAILKQLDHLTDEVRQLTAEVRQTNETVLALANRRPDINGSTAPTVPSSGG